MKCERDGEIGVMGLLSVALAATLCTGKGNGLDLVRWCEEGSGGLVLAPAFPLCSSKTQKKILIDKKKKKEKKRKSKKFKNLEINKKKI